MADRTLIATCVAIVVMTFFIWKLHQNLNEVQNKIGKVDNRMNVHENKIQGHEDNFKNMIEEIEEPQPAETN